MDYVQQIAGGLDDAQFNENNQQATRARNYFQPVINIPAITFNYNLSAQTHLQVTSHMVIGQRNSVQFINPPNIEDTFNTAIGSYNPRQVDRDYYNGFTTEARILHNYNLGNHTSTLSAGVRYFTEDTKRKQKGVGTTGSDFDLHLLNLMVLILNCIPPIMLYLQKIFFQLQKTYWLFPASGMRSLIHQWMV